MAGDFFAHGGGEASSKGPTVGPRPPVPGPVGPAVPPQNSNQPAAADAKAAVAAPWVDEHPAEANDPRSALQMRLLKAQLAAEELAGADRTGSGLKDDAEHRAASFVPQDQLEAGQVFPIKGYDNVQKTLLQTVGEMDGLKGIFEYIMHPSGSVTHQRFIENGIVNGEPNQNKKERAKSLDYESEEYRNR